MDGRKNDQPLQLMSPAYEAGLRKELGKVLLEEISRLGLGEVDCRFEPAATRQHGDYTTNVALILFASQPTLKDQFGSPLKLAEKIKAGLEKQTAGIVEKIEVAGPGFINLSVKNAVFVSQLIRLLNEKEKYGQSDFLAGKRIMLEHTSPDPIKAIHIGHLRNNFLGMAMSRLFQAHGAEVILDCVNNDRGTHVCRAMLGYLAFGNKELGWSRQQLLEFAVSDEEVAKVSRSVQWESLLDQWLTNPAGWWRPEDLNLKSDHLNLVFYSLGDRAERLVESIGPQVRQLLQAWEAEKGKVRALWRQIIDWSLNGYQQTYIRIGSRFDHVWFESDLYRGGKEIVQQGLTKGVFQKGEEGAIVTNLKPYGLPETVVIKSDGTALYLTFDLNLTKKKREYFSADVYFWDIGNDQILYLRQLFAVCDQLGFGKKEDYFHLNYGYVSLKGGEKMSSRKGTVIIADDLLDQLRDRAERLMIESREPKDDLQPEALVLAEKIGLAALKYALLRTGRKLDLRFDPESSVSLSGDCGPYLQYTYARTRSVLRKALEMKAILSVSVFDLFRGPLASFITGGRPEPFGDAAGFSFPGRESVADGVNFPRSGFNQPFSSLPVAGPFAPPVKKDPEGELVINSEEDQVLRCLARYPEVLLEAVRLLETAPLCDYLYDLASLFNQFYNQHQILEMNKDQSGAGGTPQTSPEEEGAKPNLKERLLPPANIPKVNYLRLALTAGVAQVLFNGLRLLGIEPLEKM